MERDSNRARGKRRQAVSLEFVRKIAEAVGAQVCLVFLSIFHLLFLSRSFGFSWLIRTLD